MSKKLLSTMMLLLGTTSYAQQYGQDIKLQPGSTAIVNVGIPTRVTCAGQFESQRPLCKYTLEGSSYVVYIGNDKVDIYTTQVEARRAIIQFRKENYCK